LPETIELILFSYSLSVTVYFIVKPGINLVCDDYVFFRWL